VSRIFKAKYYKGGSFLEVKKGSRPSLVWRSIHVARELLMEGLCWRVGNGKSIKIWRDKWIPRPTSYTIQSPGVLLLLEARVEELIDEQTRSWNIPLIRSLFHEDEVDIIRNIPLSRYGQPDRMNSKHADVNFFVLFKYYFNNIL
jgi:hypothetical protein